MEKEKTLSEKLDQLLEATETKDNKKKFHLPLGILMQQGKIKKKNYAIVLIIRTNGAVEIKMIQIIDNAIKFNDVYYEATAKHVLRYKKYPMLILPEWNISPLSDEKIVPFDSEQNYKEAEDKGKLSSAERFILHKLKMDEVKQKSSMNISTIIWILVGIGGLLFVLSQLKVI